MTHNELKKGDQVLLTGGRLATIYDNRRGVRRCVLVVERDGWYNDMGDVYVWEIVGYLKPDIDMKTACLEFCEEHAEPLELSDRHRAQRDLTLKVLRACNEVRGLRRR